MGRGDRFQQPSFTVPMPSEAKAWPFPPKPERPICSGCDRPIDFCECKGDAGFSSPGSALAALAVAAFLLLILSLGSR